jgi:hypothetical protein
MAIADEIKKVNIEKMGEPLGTQYSELWQELASIHIKWGEFVDAFGTALERVELLNRAAPLFFRTAQDALWEASVIHVARLTDPPHSPGGKGKSNLTVQNLPTLVADETLKSKLATLLATALKASEFSRDWRNRYIAHRDLSLALNAPAEPLAEASKKQMDEALKALSNVLNAVEVHYKKSETRFDMKARHGGAVNLLYVLYDGAKAQDARAKRLEAGEPSEEDLLPRAL